MMIRFVIILLIGSNVLAFNNETEKQLSEFIDSHLARMRPLFKQSALTSWQAACSGKSELYKELSSLNLKIRKYYSNTEEFEMLKKIKESGQVKDHDLKRQMDDLYRAYLSNQIDKDLMEQTVRLSTKIRETFNKFRGQIDGKDVTVNDIKDIMKTSKDSAQRYRAWLAGKQVGSAVAEDIIELVKLRNKAARSLGFENYHTMSLSLTQQDPDEIQKIFDELYELTAEPYACMKYEIDTILANNCRITISDIRPWHYHDPFFQETPLIYPIDLDIYYKGKDIAELGRVYYKQIGLAVEDVLAKSDLYDRQGKNPHAFCTDIDGEGDVRILCNIKDNEGWMETTLHELGHAVYSKNFDPANPYLLRGPAHSFTTEAVAMFFGRLSRNPNWMQEMLDLDGDQRDRIATVSAKYARMKQLIFARWDMVMFNFERSLYADPDQDLNGLWWDLVEKYQLVNRPEGRDEPDWASKIHIATSPCYYHNYLLGEMLASQWHNYLIRNVYRTESDETVSYVGNRGIGGYFKDKVFYPGNKYHWNEMIRLSTGEYLTPKYFVSQFVQ